MSIYLLLLPAFLLGIYAQVTLKSTYYRYSRIGNRNQLTGQQVARYILDSNGLYNIPVLPVAGQLTDHYDPTKGTINLSQGVFASTSIAAVGVAAHECGHAIQHATGYGPLKFRNAIIPITNVGSQLAMPLILLGVFFPSQNFVTIGILGYSLMSVFQLITLPVEFNASRRALEIIEGSNMLTGDELVGARATLKAAAMTYVAALVAGLSQLLALLTVFGRGRNDKDR